MTNPPAARPVSEPDESAQLEQRRAPRWRRVGWPLLATVAVVAVLAASLSVWQRRLVFDTDEWVRTVAPLPQDPVVSNAVAAYVSEAVVERLQLEQELRNRLPDAVSPLAPSLTEAVRGRLQGITVRIIESERFGDLWVAINRAAHRAAIDAIRSGGLIDATEGVAKLNLLPLVARVLAEADELGLPVLPDGRTMPDITAEMSADEGRAALGEALGRTVPDDFGEVVVYRGDQLTELQHAVKLVDGLITLLVVLAIVLVIAAVLVAPDRRRAIIRLGLAITVVLLGARAAVPSLRQLLVDAVARGDAPLVTTVFNRVVGTALEEFVFVVGVALLAVLMAFLSGPSRSARAFRAVAAGRGEPTGIVGFLGHHADAARVSGLLALIVWVMAAEETGVVALLAVVAGVVWALFVGRCERSVDAAAAIASLPATPAIPAPDPAP